jgi:uncharacterized protein
MKGMKPAAKKDAQNSYIDFLKKTFESEKPLACLLRTPSGYYLYDTGTNKIMECEKEVFELLHGLFLKEVNQAIVDFVASHGEKGFISAASEIVEAMESEKILLLKKAARFGLSDHFKDVEEILKSSIQSINIEVTHQCGQRCRYCPYNDHFKEKWNYSDRVMSIETGRKAIEFLKEHSFKNDTVMMGIYGAEPLSRFPFIKSCVEYAKEIFDKQRIVFNITTNATLITPEIADYLLQNGFSVLVSIDGPESIHNRYRKDAKGYGSYQKTMRGLKILAEKYNEIKRGQISINAVYAPPYSEEKLNMIDDHFRGLEWLPEVNVLTQYPTNGSIPGEFITEKGIEEDKDLTQWAFEKYKTDYGNSDSMIKGVLEKRFASLLQRPVLTEPGDRYNLNGCCLPGQRKCYIAAGGSIHICEKISTYAFPIGSVYTGFDFETIKKVYIDDYAEKSIGYCSRCWGIRLCDVCYIHAFNECGELDMNRKRGHCQSILNSLGTSLRNFVTLIEENPGGLDYLYKYDIK